MAMRGFRPQKVGQYLHCGALALKAGGDRIVERARHALEPKPAHRLDHVMPLHRRSSAGRNGRSRRSADGATRSEEHTSELQSLMRNSYAVFCLKKKKKTKKKHK